MATINASVGRNGHNDRRDVVTVQNLLNANLGLLTPLRPLEVDGRIGSNTIGAIVEFQRRAMRMSPPDGRVDPRGATLKALNGKRHAAADPAQRVHYPAGPQAPLAEIARPYIGARETGDNGMGTDARMREIFEADNLAPGGRTDGYAWCCSFVSMCVQKLITESAFYGHVVPPRTASVSNFRTDWAPNQHCLIFPPNDAANGPHKGDIVVFTFSHIGIVETVGTNQVRTIEGNTNEAGSREGTAVQQKTRANGIIRCFIRLPIPMTIDFADRVCAYA